MTQTSPEKIKIYEDVEQNEAIKSDLSDLMNIDVAETSHDKVSALFEKLNNLEEDKKNLAQYALRRNSDQHWKLRRKKLKEIADVF